MDPNSSLEKICLGDNVIEISSDKIEGSGDWNSSDYQDTAGSKGKKVINALSFYKMETDEISERYIAPCFVNGLEAYDGEVNLEFDENLISNKFAVKLCLDYEVKKGKKLVKKELIVALKGELYFVKFIINPEEDDFEPGVILGRSFLRLAKGVVDFELPPFVCKMGKRNRNKKRVMENLTFFYQDMGTSSSAGGYLTQEEATKEAIAIIMSLKVALLEEERPIIETMAYNDKYKKILDEVWKDKVKLDGKIVKEEEEAVKRIKGEALKEKEDPGAFIFPIRLEGKVNENTLADTGSDINTMPYRIYEQLGREDIKKVDRGITMINHTQADAMGILTNVLCQVGVTTLIAKFLILDILIDRNSPIVVGHGFLRTIGAIVNAPERLFSTFDGFCHQTFRAARLNFMRNAESDSDDEEDYQIKRNKFGAPIYGPKPAPYLNCNDPDKRLLAIQTQVNWKPDYKGSYTKEKEATGQWRTEIRLTDPNTTIMRRISIRQTNVFRRTQQLVDILNRMGCDGEIDDMLRIKLRKAESGEEIFTFVAWIRAFNIKEPIYAEFCHEFYSTYEFDEFDLVGVARRLGLYQAIELDEGTDFNVYFEGGLRSDDHFNAQEYWLSISREENLNLSRSHASTIKYPILRVEHKMNHLMLIARWMKRKGAGTQKESQICCRHFITKLARKTREFDRYYEGRLIPEDPQPGVPRVEYHWEGTKSVRHIVLGFTVFHCREPITHLEMDKGFLNRISNGSKEVNKGLLEKGSLLGNIAAKCAVHDDGIRPVHGRNDTRVNDLNSHTNDEPVEHVISSAVCLPMEAIDEIKARFVNTLYGFPVGKCLAFPMVENYVKYAWAKYGLKRVMMHHGFFMFQFDSDSGMVKGYRVNIPKSKLVYRAVVKPQGDKNVASNMGQSLDTTKKPSLSDSSMNGMSSFINDDINLEELRNFVDKSMQEESVLEQVGNYDINGCTSREKQGEKVSSKKSSSSLEILNEDSDTDVDEVIIPKMLETTFPSFNRDGRWVII
ncbi:ribonuclease H-like domain-containing protein [Tanacetum coccineum]